MHWKRQQSKINGFRNKGVKWRMGTLNVLTLRGKIEELIDMMKDRKLGILGLCETKWKGRGEKELRGGGRIYWCGNERVGRNGVALMIDKSMVGLVEEIVYISERAILVTLKLEEGKLKILQIYAPQVGSTDEEKYKFEEELEEHLQHVNVVMGDFNAHVGTDRVGYEEVLGSFGYGRRNEEGERLLDLCQRNGLRIGNSWFKKRESHTVTRYSWDGRIKSVIDYVVVDRDWGKYLTDVKVIPSVSMDGDHRLLVAQWKGKGREKTKEQRRQNRIKEWGLKDNMKAEEFKRLIVEKMPRNEMGSVEEEWRLFKETLVKSAEKVCGRTSRKRKDKETRWWNALTIQAVKEKNQAWRKWYKTRKEEDHQIYVSKKKKCKKVIEEEKEKSWNEFISSLEEDVEGNKKLFYKMMRNKRKRSEVSVELEAEDGKIVGEPEEIKTCWKEYFTKLLNSNLADESRQEENMGWDREMEGISWKEMEDAVKQMSNGKAPGPDELSVDMIRAAGSMGMQWLYRVLKCVWKNRAIPEDWKKGEIIPLFKKGNKKLCRNYRGITLMSHTTKIFERIILNRISARIEKEQSEEQHGFRPGRSTTDLIFAVRQLMEKSWEFNKKVIMLFIDVEKAYDSLDRRGLWKEMERIGIEEGYITVIKEMYRGYECRVRTPCGSTEWFGINTGVKQGSILSPSLFNVVMEGINRQVKERVGEIDKKMIFADDIMIWGETAEEVQMQLDAWASVMGRYGLKISREKSEVLICGRDKELEGEIILDGEPLKVVKSFIYLGSEINEEGRMGDEVTKRLQKGANLYQAVKHLLWNKKIPEKAKMLMYKLYYVPSVLYGAESWRMTEREWSRLQAGEMRFLRSIKGKTRWDRVRNVDIREELGVESMRERVGKMGLRWYGHVKRMSEERLPRKMEALKIAGRRPRGRPRGRWMGEIRGLVEKRGYRWEQVDDEEWWRDRGRWRGLVATQTRH